MNDKNKNSKKETVKKYSSENSAIVVGAIF